MLRSNPTYISLIRSVISAPGDDLPRLVLADFLEENGHHERGEFIRIQIEIARNASSPSPTLLARERALWTFSRDDFFECNNDVFLPESWVAEKHWEACRKGSNNFGLFIITRGFISLARIPFSIWFNGTVESEQFRLLRWHPVVKLEITDAELVKTTRKSKPWGFLDAPENLGSFSSRQAAFDGLNEYCLRSLRATN